MNHTSTSQEGFVLGVGDNVARLDKVAPLGGLVGVVGAIALAVLALSGNATIIAGSWMLGWYFWLTITMGMFALSILHHTIRPSWSVGFLRIFESGGGPASILLMAILFLPIVVHPGVIYDWADPAKVQADAVLRFKSVYLNAPFFTGRYIFFFAIWILYSSFMKNSERKQDVTRDFALEKGRSSWGAVGIVMFFITFSFAVIDWILSLEPHFSSTMLPLWQIIASALGAASFTVAAVCLNAKREPYTSIVGPNLTKDWGNILFMFTMLWAYTAISQFLIIWNGNLPETAAYYSLRSRNEWNALGMVTILGQFLVPWMVLLSPRVKRYPRLLRQIAGWIFVIHIVDVYLAVGPALPSGAGAEHRAAFTPLIGYDILAWLTVGGLWLYVFGSQVKKAPLLVAYDQRLQEALVHAH